MARQIYTFALRNHSSEGEAKQKALQLLMALDKAETQNRLDSLDQTFDSVWYPLTTGLSIISLHYQQCSGMIVGSVLR